MTSTKNMKTTLNSSPIDNPAQDVSDILNAARDESGVIDETKLMIGLVIYISNRDGKVIDHAIDLIRRQDEK